METKTLDEVRKEMAKAGVIADWFCCVLTLGMLKRKGASPIEVDFKAREDELREEIRAWLHAAHITITQGWGKEVDVAMETAVVQTVLIIDALILGTHTCGIGESATYTYEVRFLRDWAVHVKFHKKAILKQYPLLSADDPAKDFQTKLYDLMK